MGKMPVKAKLIIFDLDGTLLDSVSDIVQSVKAMLEHLNLQKKSSEEIKSSIGFGNLKLISDSLGLKNRALMEKAVKFYWEYYSSHCLDNTRPYPDVVSVLDHFKDKKKAILSNKLKEFVVDQINSLGMSKYFEEVTGGDDEGSIKPSPLAVYGMLDKFGAKKDESIIVGDMTVDIKTGKAAGIHTCAVTYGLGKREDLEAECPDFIISKLSELKEIIR